MDPLENPLPGLPSRILVISDDLDIVRWLNPLGEVHGAYIQSARAVAEAVHLLPDGNFDLLLCDLDLATQGADLEALQQHAGPRGIPWLAVSSSKETDAIVRALDCGACDCGFKPCEA